jgi:hypothetical protein
LNRQGCPGAVYVDACFDRVDVAVIEDDLDVERGMLRQEDCETGYDVQARERHRRGDPQPSLQGCGIAPRGGFRLLDLLDRPSGALIEVAACFGRCEAMCRSQQQPHAKPVLKLCDRLGDGGLPKTKLLGRARE